MITIPQQLTPSTPEIDLEHAQRMSALGELAAGLAHEIQQRLTIIANYANGGVRRLENGRLSTEQLRELLHEISSTALQANEIASRARNYSKKEALELTALNLNDVVTDSLNYVEEQLDNHQVDLELELHPQLSEVFADRTQISQVVVNMLLNAVEATAGIESDRKLSIQTTHDDNFVNVVIEDSGCGIPADIQLLIFEPFFTTKGSGLGIGLGLCRSIVERHQGQISLDSEEGKGTRIGFSLPLLVCSDSPHG